MTISVRQLGRKEEILTIFEDLTHVLGIMQNKVARMKASKEKDTFEMTHSPVCLELNRDKATDGGWARLQDLASFCGLDAHCSLRDVCHPVLGESM